MHAETSEIRTLFARLAAAEGADATRIGEIAFSVWEGVGAALMPVIGTYGVAALFKRSVYLTRDAYPCLAIVFDEAAQHGELAVLRTVLAQQTHADAVAANVALLQHFQDLLTTLIGASLTERLLRPVWNLTSSGEAGRTLS